MLKQYISKAAAAAKSLQLCPTLCDPIDSSPPGSPVPVILQQEHWSGVPLPSPMHEREKWKWSHSVVSDSLQPHGQQPTRLLRPWDSPGKSTGVGCHCLLQGIFLTQGSNPSLLQCRQILYHLSHRGSPEVLRRRNLSPISGEKPRQGWGSPCGLVGGEGSRLEDSERRPEEARAWAGGAEARGAGVPLTRLRVSWEPPGLEQAERAGEPAGGERATVSRGAWHAGAGALCPREAESPHRRCTGEPYGLTLASEGSPGFCVEAGSRWGDSGLSRWDELRLGRREAEVLGVQWSHILRAFQTESRPPSLHPSVKPGQMPLTYFLIESLSWHSSHWYFCSLCAYVEDNIWNSSRRLSASGREHLWRKSGLLLDFEIYLFIYFPLFFFKLKYTWLTMLG